MILLIAVALAAGGCSNRDKEHAERDGGHGGPGEHQDDTHGHDDADNVVRIEREMLRDLRITTAAAESRPAERGRFRRGWIAHSRTSRAGPRRPR